MTSGGLVILAPFTKEVPEALSSLPPDAHRVDVSGDPHDYWRAFADAWHLGGFVLVEHDVVLEPTTAADLETCPEKWCLHRYTSGHVTHRAFGCVRFSESLTRELPNLPDRVLDRHWRTLDCHVFYLLYLAGFVFHEHTPTLHHLNPSYR